MALSKDETLRRETRLIDRIMVEGDPWYAYATLLNGTISANQVIGSIGLQSLTKAFWIESVTISSNRQVDIQFSIGGTFANQQQITRLILYPGVPAIIPIRSLVRPTLAAAGVTAIGEFRIRTVLDATPTGAYVIGSAAGYAIYDDFNTKADKVMLVIADSILNGTAGITGKPKSMEWLTRGYFRDQGANLRVINKSVSGSTTSDHERFRAHGLYDFPQVDYLHYQLGTNDAGAGASAATVQANVAAMIAHKQKLYPDATMIVWGPTPRENTTTETTLISLRTGMQAAVTAAADPKVKYASLAAAFDRTLSSNYASSDTAGDRIHPNDAGHAAAYSLIQAFLSAQNVSI